MNAPFDSLEKQLHNLRPARMPDKTRRTILQEIQQPRAAHSSWTLWQFLHHTGFQVALAGAFSLALWIGWHWLPRSLENESAGNVATIVASNGLVSSLAFWEAEVAAAEPRQNTVTLLRSPSTLTNIQIRR